MPKIHKTAILEGSIELADDVEIGPYCVLNGPIAIGAGTRLIASVYLHGPVIMGERNLLYPNVALGYAPQSIGFDIDHAGPGVRIGADNTLREGVTIHRAIGEDGPTLLGDHNFLLVNSHMGHNAQVDNYCLLANGVLLGGFVRLYDRAFVGGNTAIHQFCRVGRGAFLSGSAGLSRDLPPFFTLTGINIAASVNMVGMRRLEMTDDEIRDVRWVYKTIYRSKLTPSEMLAALTARADRPLVREYIEFIETSERGICSAIPDPRREI